MSNYSNLSYLSSETISIINYIPGALMPLMRVLPYNIPASCKLQHILVCMVLF